MPVRILYSQQNLAEVLKIELKHVKMLTRLGVIPSLEGYSPIRYCKAEIDEWVASGNLELHRPSIGYHHTKGIY